MGRTLDDARGRPQRRGVDAFRLLTWGLPVSLAALALCVALGPAAGARHWALWCVAGSVVTVCQPAVGAAFPVAQAGHALSAFNLAIFSGVFAVQWGIGLVIDGLQASGFAEVAAYRAAFGAYTVLSLAAYLWYLRSVGRALRIMRPNPDRPADAPRARGADQEAPIPSWLRSSSSRTLLWPPRCRR